MAPTGEKKAKALETRPTCSAASLTPHTSSAVMAFPCCAASQYAALCQVSLSSASLSYSAPIPPPPRGNEAIQGAKVAWGWAVGAPLEQSPTERPTLILRRYCSFEQSKLIFLGSTPIELKLCEPQGRYYYSKSAHLVSASHVQMGPRNVRVKSGYFCPKPVLGYKIGGIY